MSSWLNKLQTLQTWEAVLGSLGALVGMIWAAIAFMPKLIRALKRLYDVALFTADIREHHDAMRCDVVLGFSRLDDKMAALTQMHQSFLDTNPSPWFFADERGFVTWVNRRWRKLTGLEVHEAKGRGWENGIASEDRARVIAAWEQAVTHQRAFDEVVTYIDRDGRRTRLQVTASPNRRQDGTITGWLGHGTLDEDTLL